MLVVMVDPKLHMSRDHSLMPVALLLPPPISDGLMDGGMNRGEIRVGVRLYDIFRIYSVC